MKDVSRKSLTRCVHNTLASRRYNKAVCKNHARTSLTSWKCYKGITETLWTHHLCFWKMWHFVDTWPLPLEDVSDYHGQCVDTGLLLSDDVSRWSQTICLWTQDPCLWQMWKGHHVYFANKWPFALSWCDGVVWRFWAHSTLASMRCGMDITRTLCGHITLASGGCKHVNQDIVLFEY